MNSKRKFLAVYALPVFVVLFLKCTALDPFDSDKSPGKLPLSTLLAASDTLSIDDKSYVLETDLWRDFQPVSPPDGKPLIAIFTIATLDSSDFPGDVQTDAAWIVNNDEIWDTYFSNEKLPSDRIKPYELKKIVRNGPKFGPEIYVDVVVRIICYSGKSYLLKASNQYIVSTE